MRKILFFFLNQISLFNVRNEKYFRKSNVRVHKTKKNKTIFIEALALLFFFLFGLSFGIFLFNKFYVNVNKMVEISNIFFYWYFYIFLKELYYFFSTFFCLFFLRYLSIDPLSIFWVFLFFVIIYSWCEEYTYQVFTILLIFVNNLCYPMLLRGMLHENFLKLRVGNSVFFFSF